MKLSPRYEGPPIITIQGQFDDCAEPVRRQRRRFETMLTGLSSQQWSTPSRCDGWSVHDVVAHLVGVNSFWAMSVHAGISATPTRVLANFDPAATPPLMVEPMRSLPSDELLAQFISTNTQFLDALADLDEQQWSATAESPAGHVSVRMLTYHALWDSWIHERDVALPLGIEAGVYDDEIACCLRYAAAISPGLALSNSAIEPGKFSVHSKQPDMEFTLIVTDAVDITNSVAHDTVALEGDAVELIESLSIRTPLPMSAPKPWRELLTGLALAFDSSI